MVGDQHDRNTGPVESHLGEAGLLGYGLTRALDLVPAIRVQAQVTGGTNAADAAARTAGGPLAAGLILVGGLASFTMGGNDVANATGSLVGSGTFSPPAAGLIGGLGLAAGVLTWGRPVHGRDHPWAAEVEGGASHRRDSPRCHPGPAGAPDGLCQAWR
jgi:hypothetical protein